MFYITGDLHGEYDIHKLSSKRFPMGNNLTRDDYLIICGDFGLVWNNGNSESIGEIGLITNRGQPCL